MTHTSDLDHALAEALHEADMVQIRVLDRAADGTPKLYRAVAWYGGAQFSSSPKDTAIEALGRAIRLLRAAKGEGGMQIVDFAAIEITGGTS